MRVCSLTPSATAYSTLHQSLWDVSLLLCLRVPSWWLTAAPQRLLHLQHSLAPANVCLHCAAPLSCPHHLHVSPLLLLGHHNDGYMKHICYSQERSSGLYMHLALGRVTLCGMSDTVTSSRQARLRTLSPQPRVTCNSDH
jgi:hypothetical protein